MKGDILIIGEHHQKAAVRLFGYIEPLIRQNAPRPFVITIAGESGAGKSEIAAALADILEQNQSRVRIIQQDDFFIYPPRTNARMRESDIGHVGPHEVRLDLLNETIAGIHDGRLILEKPLVIFEEDRIIRETIDLRPYRVIIIEGTYTTLLNGADCRIFIDRDLNDTREDRKKRNREKQDEYLEKILEIEHRIISQHKKMANLLITKDFEVENNERSAD
jgi:uridine kinase